MKKTVLRLTMIFGVVLSSVQFQAQTENLKTSLPEIQGAEITFETETHDYGQIAYDSNGDCYFEFTNTGSAPLTITNAVGSCGCTVPEWPREPIQPGETGKLKVTYKTTKVGLISKTVSITSNAENSPTKIIRIKGEVLPKEETSK